MTDNLYQINHRRKTHDLKIAPEHWRAIYDGLKTFEIRNNDRDFREGDILLLREYMETKTPNMPNNQSEAYYTGAKAFYEITYITNYQQKSGWIVMAIKRLNVFVKRSNDAKN